VRRPSPTLVREIGERLSETVDSVSPPALVAAIQRETGCSRATAYRAVRDFLAQLDSRYGVPSRGSGATARRAGCLADLNSGPSGPEQRRYIEVENGYTDAPYNRHTGKSRAARNDGDLHAGRQSGAREGDQAAADYRPGFWATPICGQSGAAQVIDKKEKRQRRPVSRVL